MDMTKEVLDAISSGGFVGTDGKWNSLIFKDGKLYRNRVETLIINDAGEIFMQRFGDSKYRLPGGGVERDGDKKKQAIAECREEAYINIKNVQYSGIITEELYNNSHYKSNNIITYDGKITTLFTARFGSMFTGYIPNVDRDNGMRYDGKFYPYESVKSILKEEHIKAYESRMYSKQNNTKKILPYYTPNQMEEIGVYNIDPEDNFFKVKASKDNSDWFKSYSETYDPGDNWLRMVREAYTEYIKNKSPENKQTLLELGWNPSINVMNDSILYSISESTKQILKYNTTDIQIIN